MEETGQSPFEMFSEKSKARKETAKWKRHEYGWYWLPQDVIGYARRGQSQPKIHDSEIA
jgi:hypothetical protein